MTTTIIILSASIIIGIIFAITAIKTKTQGKTKYYVISEPKSKPD